MTYLKNAASYETFSVQIGIRQCSKGSLIFLISFSNTFQMTPSRNCRYIILKMITYGKEEPKMENKEQAADL